MTNYAGLKDIVDKVNSTEVNKTAINLESIEDQKVDFAFESEISGGADNLGASYIQENFSEEEFLDDESFEEVFSSTDVSGSQNDISTLVSKINADESEGSTNSGAANTRETPASHVRVKSKDGVRVLQMPTKSGGKLNDKSAVLPTTLRDMDEMKKVYAEFSSLDLTNANDYKNVQDLVGDQIDELLQKMANMSLEQIDTLSEEEKSIFEMYYTVHPFSGKEQATAKFCKFKKLTDPEIMNNPAIKSAPAKFKSLALKLIKNAEFEASLNDTVRISTITEDGNAKFTTEISYAEDIKKPINTLTGIQIYPYKVKVTGKQTNWSSTGSLFLEGGDMVTLDTGVDIKTPDGIRSVNITPIGILDGVEIETELIQGRLVVSFKSPDRKTFSLDDIILDVTLK